MEQGLSALLAAGFPGLPLFLGITAVLSYLLGCCNGAVLVSKYILHDDVRKHGSGNAGLTNFLRTFGGKLTAVVLAADLVKMAVAVLLSWGLFFLWGDMSPMPVFVKYWSGFFCIVGHMYPCMFRFQGGKGILCGGMMSIMVDWRVALCVWGAFFIGVLLTRWVSLGSCMGAVSFCVSTLVFYGTPSVAVLSIAMAVVMLWKHRGNLVRIAKGQEPKLSIHRKKAES